MILYGGSMCDRDSTLAEKVKIWLIGGGGDMVNGLDGREMGVGWRQRGI